VGELYNLAAFPIDDGDETRTCGDHRLFCVLGTPCCVKCREFCLVEPDCENLGKFFDAKRANRHCKTSEESLGISSFLLVDA
jgi:hypothetical protein